MSITDWKSLRLRRNASCSPCSTKWIVKRTAPFGEGEKTVDISQASFYTKHVKKTRGACVPG